MAEMRMSALAERNWAQIGAWLGLALAIPAFWLLKLSSGCPSLGKPLLIQFTSSSFSLSCWLSWAFSQTSYALKYTKYRL